MKKTTLSILLIALSFSQLALAANKKIYPFTATYQVRAYGTTLGSIKQVLTRNKGRYHFTTTTEASFLFYHKKIVEQSWGSWRNQWLRPTKYTIQSDQQGKKHNYQLRFNWKNRTITNLTNPQKWQFSTSASSQDNVSFQLLLRQNVLNHKKNLRYSVADRDESKTYTYKIATHVTLKIPAGTYKTVEVTRSDNSKRVTEFWFAKKYNYLPIKVEQLKKGKRQAVAVVESFEITPTT